MDGKIEPSPRTYWEKTWARFLKHHGMIAPSAKLVQLMIPHVPRNGIVVDLGCGEGRNTLCLSRIGYRSIGIDLSFKAIKVLHNNLFEEEVKGLGLVADAVALPFATDSVHAVLAHHLFDHLDSDAFTKAIRETYRILSPKGILLMTMGTFREIPDRQILKHADGTMVFKSGPQKGMLVRPYEDEDLARLSSCGWKVCREDLTPRNSKILMLEKPAADS